MALFTRALRELGDRVTVEYSGRFLGLVAPPRARPSGWPRRSPAWPTWHDVSAYDGAPVPFYKRAQIAAADLHLAGIAPAEDVDRLTLFADNLVPHVLRLDGVLEFDEWLVGRIDAGCLLEHGSPEEVEIRACALHAVELLVAAHGDTTRRWSTTSSGTAGRCRATRPARATARARRLTDWTLSREPSRRARRANDSPSGINVGRDPGRRARPTNGSLSATNVGRDPGRRARPTNGSLSGPNVGREATR